MAIRFRLPAHAMERVAHASSPLLETVLSLHVIVEPKHHPLQHPWIRRQMRSLPAQLKREIAAFAFFYRRHVPDVFAPSPIDDLRSFEDELAALRGLDEGTIALEFSRPLYDHGGRRDPSLVQREEVQERIVASARLAGGDPELARLIFENPAALAERFANLLSDYWDAAFQTSGRRSSPGSRRQSPRQAGGWPARGSTPSYAPFRPGSASTSRGSSSASTSRTATRST